MATQGDSINKLIELMKSWQKIEVASVKNTSEIIRRTDNPLIKIIMEIIRQDSIMHKRVQQIIVDHFEKKTIMISHDELQNFWELIEVHEEIEKKTIKLAKEAKDTTTSLFAKYLLDYLLTDEQKHDKLLNELAKIKNNEYPYGEGGLNL